MSWYKPSFQGSGVTEEGEVESLQESRVVDDYNKAVLSRHSREAAL